MTLLEQRAEHGVATIGRTMNVSLDAKDIINTTALGYGMSYLHYP